MIEQLVFKKKWKKYFFYTTFYKPIASFTYISNDFEK